MGIDLKDKKIPKEAIRARETIEELLDGILVGIYLYGSAVMGGLRGQSDVDILAVIHQNLSEGIRRKLTQGLMMISGEMGNTNAVRPLEVTIINQKNVVPWHFPPRYEFLYGEWLRKRLENGDIPQPTIDPDLAILLAQARGNSISLTGPELSDILEPIPMADIEKAIRESLPALIEDTKGDERNIILTLARMWFTMANGEIVSKDMAAEWAIPRLPEEYAALLDCAKRAYLGEWVDHWEGMECKVAELAHYMKRSILS